MHDDHTMHGHSESGEIVIPRIEAFDPSRLILDPAETARRTSRRGQLRDLIVGFSRAALAGGGGGCNIAFRNNGAEASGGNPSVALPSGWQAGDLAICVAHAGTGVGNPSMASGWTNIWVTANDGMWYRRLQSGDANPTVSYTAGQVSAVIAAWSGCVAGGNPIDAYSPAWANNSSSGNNVSVSGISLNTANDMVIFFIQDAYFQNSTYSSWASGGNAPSQKFNVSNLAPAFAAAQFTQAAAGSTGTCSAVGTVGYSYLKGFLLALKTS
jgi:hypothetical protein